MKLKAFFFFSYDPIERHSKSRQIEMAPENLATPATRIGGLGGAPSPRGANMPYTGTYTGGPGTSGVEGGGPRGSRAPDLPHRRTPAAHRLHIHTKVSNMFGTSISETTMRPLHVGLLRRRNHVGRHVPSEPDGGDRLDQGALADGDRRHRRGLGRRQMRHRP